MRLPAVIFITLSAVSAYSQIKETPPPGAAAKPFKLAATEDFTLPNGMRVTLTSSGAVPKVTVRAFVDAGSVREAADKIWISKLTALMMNEGTTKLSSEQVAQRAADMGGQVEINSSEDTVSAGGIVLSEFGPDFVALLADVLANAALPASELPRLKADLNRQLAVEKTQPSALAQERFLQTMFPGQPYGRVYPGPEALAAYQISDVQDFFARNFAASRTHLYVAGKFDAAAVKSSIQKAFSGWKKGEPAALPVPKPASQYSLQSIDRPGASQSSVALGLPLPGPKNADYISLDVMNSLLGGSFGSRITSNIREDKGYTYSPYSYVGKAGQQAYWVEVAEVTTAVTGPSLKEIFSEVKRLRKDSPSQEELKGIQSYLAGIFVLRNTSSPDAIIRQLHFVDSQELERSFLFNYVRKVEAVTPAEIQRVSETYLAPSKMTVVVVGDQSKVGDQLKAFAAVPQ